MNKNGKSFLLMQLTNLVWEHLIAKHAKKLNKINSERIMKILFKGDNAVGTEGHVRGVAKN